MSDRRPAGSESAAKRAKTTGVLDDRNAKYSELLKPGLTISCTELSPEDLELDPLAATDWKQLKGLAEAKRCLRKRLLLPTQHSEFFDLAPGPFGKSGSNGKIPVKRTLCIFGQNGMGKRRLLYNACKEARITLFWVDPLQFDPFAELQGIYERAIATAPSMVVLSECEFYFSEGRPPVGKLRSILASIAEKRLSVWTVFRMNQRPETLALDLRPSPDCQIPVETLTINERIDVFESAVNSKLYRPEVEPLGLDPEVKNRCCGATVNCTPADIHHWVERVFEKALFDHTAEMDSKPREDRIFYPTDEDFINMLDTADGRSERITSFDPVEKNIRPYLDEAGARNARMSRNYGGNNGYS